MAELTQKERLQPSLLDRLTDDSPTERRESRDKHVISPSRLRECVRRDLTWLLNTSNLAALENLDSGLPAPSQAGLVLNYGMPDLAGHVAVPAARRALCMGAAAMANVIWDFLSRG